LKKIAILGGSHFIGVHLFNALHKQGHQITLYNRKLRTPPVPYPEDIVLIRGDRNKPEDLKNLFNKDFDVVFDLSGYTPKHVQPIIENYSDNIGHYIFCSTPNVYNFHTYDSFNEKTSRIFEENTYGGDKALVEELLLKQNMVCSLPITIFRPQGVFGPYDTWQAGFIYYRLVHSLPLFVFQESKYRLNPLFVTDLIEAFILAVDNSISYGSIYGVAGDDVISNIEFIDLCAKITSYQPQINTVAPPYSINDFQTGYSWLDYDFIADCNKIKIELEIKFTKLEDALKKTFSWLKDNPIHMERYSYDNWKLMGNYRKY